MSLSKPPSVLVTENQIRTLPLGLCSFTAPCYYELMRELRYTALPFKLRGVASWMVCEDRTGRIVKMPLIKPHAYTLAHMLNVADLETPLEDYNASDR